MTKQPKLHSDAGGRHTSFLQARNNLSMEVFDPSLVSKGEPYCRWRAIKGRCLYLPAI
nr:hypothetical protein Q903MT_gene6356 [Picea sitchensis]